jgi:hypothetical protein
MVKGSSSRRRRPQLSIVVPAGQNHPLLESGLVSILENRPDDCEVVIVLNSAYDDPYALDGEVEFVKAPEHASLATCLNQGIAASHGELILLLGCGVELTSHGVSAAIEQFDNPQVGAVAPLLLDGAEDDDRVLCTGLEYGVGGVRRLRQAGLAVQAVPAEVCRVMAPSLWGAFYRRAALEQVGMPFDSQLGSRFVPTAAQENLQPTFATGRRAEMLFWRYAPTWGWRRALAAHAACWLRDVRTALINPRGVLQLVGRMSALGAIPGCTRHWHVLAQLAGRAPEPAAVGSTVRRVDRAHRRSRAGTPTSRAIPSAD